MENVELWFFAVGVVLTLVALVAFYLLLYEHPLSPFARRQTIQVGEWELHYHMQGRGQPLVLVHGIGSSLHCWDDLLPLLVKHYKVIAVDLPGFGQSSKHEKVEYGLDEQADRLERFLTALKIERAFLVGHSMGGNLVLWMGRLHPERFPSIVVIGPAAHPKLAPWGAGIMGGFARPASWFFGKPVARFAHRYARGMPERLNEDAVTHTLNVYRNNPTAIRTFLAATRAIRDPRILSETFKSRVLVLHGAKDRLVPRWAIDKLMPRLPESTLAVHPKAGHMLQHDDPEWTFDQIQKFLSAELDEHT